MIVVGLDLSLTSTGVAVVNADPGAVHGVKLSRATSKAGHNTVEARSVRLRGLAGSIVAHCATADLIVVESPVYAAQAASASVHDRAGLWWLVVARLTGAGKPVAEVSPTAVKTYATGAGNAKKDQVLAAVVRRYAAIPVVSNDEADALVLASMGCRALNRPIESLPQTHLRAMAKVAWPERTENGHHSTDTRQRA